MCVVGLSLLYNMHQCEYIQSHAGSSSSSVRAIARSIVALEGQSVNLRCIPKPITAALRWTFGGGSLLSGGLKFKLGRLNQTLFIKNLTMENSGEYNCHVVGVDDITATIDVNVKAGTVSTCNMYKY